MTDATLACLALSVLPVTALFWVSAPVTDEEVDDAEDDAEGKNFFQRLFLSCDQDLLSYEDVMLQCSKCTDSCRPHELRCFSLRLDEELSEGADECDDDDGVEEEDS